MGKAKRTKGLSEAKKVAHQVRDLVERVLEGKASLDDVREAYERHLRRLRALDSLEYALTEVEVLILLGEPLKVLESPQKAGENIEAIKAIFEHLLEEIARLERPLTLRERRLTALVHGMMGVISLERDYDLTAMMEHVRQFDLYGENIRFRWPEEGFLFLEILERFLAFFLNLRDEWMFGSLLGRTREALDILVARFPEEDWLLPWVLKFAWYSGRFLRGEGKVDRAVSVLEGAPSVLENLEDIRDTYDMGEDPEGWAYLMHWAMMVGTELAGCYGEMGDARVLAYAAQVHSWLKNLARDYLPSESQAMFRARLDAAQGWFHALKGERKKAISALEQAAGIYTKNVEAETFPIFPGFHAEAGEMLRWLAWLHEQVGQIDQALRYARACADMVEDAMDFDKRANRLYAWAWTFRATHFQKGGDIQKALKETEEAVRYVLPAAIGEEDRDKAIDALVALYETLVERVGQEVPPDIAKRLEEYKNLGVSSDQEGSDEESP